MKYNKPKERNENKLKEYLKKYEDPKAVHKGSKTR